MKSIAAITDVEFSLLRDFLRTHSGIEIQANKRYLFKTRLTGFLDEHGYSGFSELYNRLTKGRDCRLLREFVQSMTTHESSFFRDRHPFELFFQVLLPGLMKKRAAQARYLPPRLRIFSAGCSKGQEPYSIAMCVDTWLKNQQEYTWDNVVLTAGDISQKVLKEARRGEYLEAEVGTHVRPEFRSCFDIKGKTWTVREDLRSRVRFCEFNLAEPFGSVGKFDIVFCRNVIIYFPLELKKKILDQFFRMINPGGALLVGSSESLFNLTDKFEAHHELNSTWFEPCKPKV